MMFGDIVQVDLPVWLARKYYGKEMRRRERRAFCSTTGKKKKKCGPSLRLVPAALVPEVSVSVYLRLPALWLIVDYC